MRVTKRQLRRIIREERTRLLEAEDEAGAGAGDAGNGAAAAASKAELKQLLLQLSKKTQELDLSKKEVQIIGKTLKGLMAAANLKDIAGKAQPFLAALGKLIG